MRLALLVLLAALLASAPALAEEPDAGPVHVLTRAPTLLKFVQAAYPAEAEAQKLQGEVLLQVDLGADGKVSAVQVLQGAGHGFDEAALAAVQQFEFSPALIDDQPAPVRLTYRYAFTLTPEVPDAGPVAPSADGGVAPAEAKHQVTFDGTVLERGTRAPLLAAQVVALAPDGGEPAEATTDAQGHFAFEDLAPGGYHVVVVAQEHEKFETEEAVLPGQATHATYFVRKTTYSAYETVVTGKREKKEVARTTLKQEEIKLIPGTNGDALKVVQSLPGVARAPYGIGLIIVRGSKPWDTRVYIDDVIVPQLFHFGGLVAVFNSDLLKDINFQPGNFNADYGRAIGGLITAETREPAKQGFHGYVNINVIDTSLLLEGPLTEELSIAVAARRSYIDTVLDRVLPVVFPNAGLSFTLAPRYYDYQLKADYHPKWGRDRVTVLGFGSDDRLALLLDNSASIDPEARATFESHVSFAALSATWVHPFTGSRLTNRLTAYGGFITTDNAFGPDIQATNTFNPLRLLDVLSAEVVPALTLEGGLDLYGGPYHYVASVPGLFHFDQVPDPVASRQLIRDDGYGQVVEPALFAQAVWKPRTPLGQATVVPGVRGDYDATMHRFWVDPRLALLHEFERTGTTVKAAVGLYHQPPDFRQGLLLPKFGNPDLGPEASQQYMVSVEQRLLEGLHLEVQGYYKWLFNQVQTSNKVVIRDGQPTPEHFDNGATGRSYGVEILLRQELTKRLFGWIAYSLERTQVCSARYSLTGTKPDCTPFRDANWVTFPLDQPHHLIAVLSYKLPLDFIAGVRLQYSSGNPVTPIATSVYDADGDIYFPVPGKYLTDRAPAFFQLDARVDKRFVFDRWMLTLFLDVQNVTNRANPEYTLYNFDYTQRGYLSGLPIIPNLGVKGEF